MSKILITGGTGLIGKLLQQKLEANKHHVVILTRNPKKENHFKWDISSKFIDDKAFQNIDYIIHLAGAGIADKRWTTARKKELIDSRVESANLLFSKVKELNITLKGFISSSGMSYYGAINSENIFTENDSPGNDFISKICIEWEKAANQFKKLNTPVTILRTGIVLSKNGGALKKMNTPLFLSALGNGKQYIPWIHIDDLCNLYIKAVEDVTFTGIFNAVTTEHQTNTSFTKILGSVLKKPITPFNVPGFVLKMLLGELSVILLKGSRVSSKKTATHYSFKYTKLQEALIDVYSK